MNATTSVLCLVALSSRPIREIVRRSPYAPSTVYEAVEGLINEGLLVRTRSKGGPRVTFSDGYRSQKLRQLHVLALSHGIDPEELTRDSTFAVWRTIQTPRKVVEVSAECGLSSKWVRKILSKLEVWGIATFLKRKPIVVERDAKHPVNEVLRDLVEGPMEGISLHLPGTVPFTKEFITPRKAERTLMDGVEGGLIVRGTGFRVVGEGGVLKVIDIVPSEPVLEEVFLRLLVTTEGVEDLCVRVVASGSLDHSRLLTMAVERGMVNAVGCYLDILNDLGVHVEASVLGSYHEHKTEEVITFLMMEKSYGKGGWEETYERRWNIDIYLDRGAIRHGVRSI